MKDRLIVVAGGGGFIGGHLVDLLLERAHEQFDDDRYTRLEDIVLQYDGYSLESRASEILEGLNIPTATHKEPLSVLSGGYKLRALLGKTLASEPDILLLDEPTNPLDILSIQFLIHLLPTSKSQDLTSVQTSLSAKSSEDEPCKLEISNWKKIVSEFAGVPFR